MNKDGGWMGGLGFLMVTLVVASAQGATVDPLRGGEKSHYFDRVRAVPRRPMLKAGRVELKSDAGVSLNDPYYVHSASGVALTFFPSEFWGITLGGSYFFSRWETPNLDLVRQGLIALPAEYELPETFVYLDLQWIPLYGKLSLFSRGIAHYETYFALGGGAHLHSDASARPAGVAAIGERVVVADWLTFSIELRDWMYRGEYGVYHEKRRGLQHYLMVSGGISFYLPPSFEYSH